MEVIPDIGLKIATKREALWETVRKEAEYLIKQSKDSLIIQEEILRLAERKLAEEEAVAAQVE